MINFEAAVALAVNLSGFPDRRPQWLRELDCADLDTEQYYKFLFELHAQLGNFDAIEIGTLYGSSAAHLACENLGRVITIDIDPGSKAKCDAFGLVNLEAITGNSSVVLPDLISSLVDQGVKVDVLYIDGQHDFGNAYTEYVGYRQLVRDGGLIILDDIHFPMDGDEMNVFWSLIEEPKADVSWLHTRVGTGYGIVQKRNSHTPLSFEAAHALALPIIQSRRK